MAAEVRGAETAPAIPNAVRLSQAEQATAARLLATRPGLQLTESPHVGAEYVDGAGRTYDAMGSPAASRFWNQDAFLASIEHHLTKATDFTVIDLTGFTDAQVGVVRGYVNTLPAASQAKIIRIGF